MNWLKDLFFAESWAEFWFNLGVSSAMLAGLWVFLWAAMIFFEAPL
jgi:hypothetical protein